MRIDFVTLFPEMISGVLRQSMMSRAADSGRVHFGTCNPRDFCYDRHQKVDDTPFGGEPGMLIKPEPVALALASLKIGPETAVILTDPAGVPFTQETAQSLSSFSHVVFLCGHYEGIDHRIETTYCTHSFSVGDFVLTNGELPALTMADSIVRLLPGVLGNQQSLAADSHSDGLLSAPNFTRPEEWRGIPIPEVLKSGNHKAIAKWRRTESLKTTAVRRPDLLARAHLEKSDLDVLS